MLRAWLSHSIGTHGLSTPTQSPLHLVWLLRSRSAGCFYSRFLTPLPLPLSLHQQRLASVSPSIQTRPTLALPGIVS